MEEGRPRSLTRTHHPNRDRGEGDLFHGRYEVPRHAQQFRPQNPDLSVEEAAARLGVHGHTVRRYIAKGYLPAYRLNGYLIRVRPEDVDNLATRIPTAGAR
jgi:excisionase family DNA binding protein